MRNMKVAALAALVSTGALSACAESEPESTSARTIELGIVEGSALPSTTPGLEAQENPRLEPGQVPAGPEPGEWAGRGARRRVVASWPGAGSLGDAWVRVRRGVRRPGGIAVGFRSVRRADTDIDDFEFVNVRRVLRVRNQRVIY